MGWLIFGILVVLVIVGSLIPEETPSCKICGDSKEVETIVMGTDTAMVECPYCSTKEKYMEFQKWVNNESKRT
jgi:hypothetical protein